MILPELILTLIALLSQLSAALYSKKAKLIAIITIILSIIVIFLIIKISTYNRTGFNNSFVNNDITGIVKLIVLIFSIMTIIIYNDYCEISGDQIQNEFITLVLLSTVGTFIAISSRNFLLLFSSMELQSLVFYSLAGFSVTNIKSSEAALKYFILGALISCLTLFGISFIYGSSMVVCFQIRLKLHGSSRK